MQDKEIDLFNEFSTDDKKANEGVYVPFKGGIEFLIAKFKNRTFRRAMQRFVDDHEAEAESTDQDLQDKLIVESSIYSMARGVLLGWKGPLKFKGESLTYSVANAEKLLQMEDFRDWVTMQAQKQSNFRDSYVKEAEGNSTNTSAGTSSGGQA